MPVSIFRWQQPCSVARGRRLQRAPRPGVETVGVSSW
jgi:hypothetical protein